MKLRYVFCALAFIMHQSLYGHYTFIVGQEVTAWVEDNRGTYAEQVDTKIKPNDFVIVRDNNFLEQGANFSEWRYYLGKVIRIFRRSPRLPIRYEVSFVASGRSERCLQCSDVLVPKKSYDVRALVVLPANCNACNCDHVDDKQQNFAATNEPASSADVFAPGSVDKDGFPEVFFDENGELVLPDNFLNS